MARPKGRTIITQPCEHCGALVSRRKGQEREHTFCSSRCYWDSDFRKAVGARTVAQRFPEGKREVLCDGCGATIRRPASKVCRTNFCSRDCRARYRREKPARQINSGGYALVFVGRGEPGANKTGHILEHRKVMQDLLGRPLLADENVHHKNGVRDDNRPENLELWSRSQPRGQRVADKIRWAREFLALYEHLGESDGREEG